MSEIIIDVKKLEKIFSGGVKAVNDVSFDVKKGEVFGFLGPNGAGKSTTIKILTTLLIPSNGQLAVNGYNPLKQKNEVRRSIGIVFQDSSVDDDLTAEENLNFHGVVYGMTKQQRKERIPEMLKFVDLYDRRNDLVKQFSGGMKRRLEIARGFMHHPKILFLDEPTLGLDPQTRSHMWQYVKKLNKEEDMTVFFTTHYMEEADRAADRLAIIDHGKIITIGMAEEIKKKAQKPTLEEAFILLTGHHIRDEEASLVEFARKAKKMWSGSKK